MQYLRFLGNALTAEFGRSVRTGTPVTELIATTLPVTAWLSLYAIVIAVVTGVASGVLAAVRRGRWPELAVNGLLLVALSVPHFWLGLVAILYLAVGWAGSPPPAPPRSPSTRCAGLWQLTLPAIILGTGITAVRMRQTRSSMIDTLDADYVRTARRALARDRRGPLRPAQQPGRGGHARRPTARRPDLRGGATERIFALPGLGKLTLDSVFSRDYPVVQGVVLVVTAAYIVINLAVDVLYSVLDPRIRVGGRSG